MLCALIAISVQVLVAFGANPSGAVAAIVRPAAKPQPITPMLGLCDTSNVLDVLGDLSDADASKKRNQIALLQGRIIDCSRKITESLAPAPVAAPTPYWISVAPAPVATHAPAAVCIDPPGATTASNRIALYEILQRCAAYWTALSATATPAPGATPLASIASRPTFYVFATGAVDPPTATVLIRSLVGRLIRAQRRSHPLPSPAGDDETGADVVVAGRADWTTPDSFASQCQLDPNTRGAVVIESSIPETYRHNYFLLAANFTTVSAAVDVLGCGAQDHNPAASPLSLHREEALSGKAHQDALTLGLFTTIATLLAVSDSKTTVTTGGGSTTVTKTDANAPVFTGSVLGYFENQNLTLPAQNANVALSVAGERFADGTMARLRNVCKRPEIARLAAEANPDNNPPPPLKYRTLAHRAAFEYISDCNLFANFDSPR